VPEQVLIPVQQIPESSQVIRRHVAQVEHVGNVVIGMFVVAFFGHKHEVNGTGLELPFRRNFLARHEVTTGLYYHRRGAYVSAINRAEFLLETYPQSEFEADGAALLAASYEALGKRELAADARRVLEMNYPEHPFLAGNWPERGGLWGQLNPFAGGR